MTRLLYLTHLAGKTRAIPRRAVLLTFHPSVGFSLRHEPRSGMRPLYLCETTLQARDWVYHKDCDSGRYMPQDVCDIVNAMSYAEREAHWLPYTLRRRDR